MSCSPAINSYKGVFAELVLPKVPPPILDPIDDPRKILLNGLSKVEDGKDDDKDDKDDKNIKDHKNQTYKNLAFYNALENGNMNMCKFLVENGANPNVTGRFGKSVLHYLVDHDQYILARWFIDRKVDVNAKDEHGYTALHCAALKGSIEMCELLLKTGATEW